MTETVPRTAPTILLSASQNKSVILERVCGACRFWSGRCRLEQGRTIHLAADVGCDRFQER